MSHDYAEEITRDGALFDGAFLAVDAKLPKVDGCTRVPQAHQRTVSMLLKLSKAFIKVEKYRKITIFMTPNVNEYIGTSRWLNDLK
jgi:hypothetical protein